LAKRNHNNDRTVTRSFRISERSLKALEDDAKRQNVSVSTLLNQLLAAHTEFDRYLRRLGLIKLSSDTFQRILEAASDENIATAGFDAGLDAPRSIILAKHGILNIDTVIDFLETHSEHSGIYQFGEVRSEGNRKITLLHRLGPRGSIFLANYMKPLFDSIGHPSKITTSEHSVLVEIDGSDLPR
jgi:hypothetical protein